MTDQTTQEPEKKPILEKELKYDHEGNTLLKESIARIGGALTGATIGTMFGGTSSFILPTALRLESKGLVEKLEEQLSEEPKGTRIGKVIFDKTMDTFMYVSHRASQILSAPYVLDRIISGDAGPLHYTWIATNVLSGFYERKRYKNTREQKGQVSES